MDQTAAARLLMGDSLGFHIIFALLGVGLPLVILILEGLAIRRRDEELRRTAKLWSYIAGILVITGVLSGTVIALQMFLVWPGILQFGGEAIGLGFAWEGYAFIVEAIFLGFYLKTWDTLRGWAHWAMMLPVWLGATASAFLITSVDAWMNHPSGIQVSGGKVVAAEPLTAIFNQTTYLQASHSILGYYLTAILLAMAVIAWKLLHGQKGKAAGSLKLAAGRLGVVALTLLVAIGVLGDLSAKYLAEFEPTKLAAIESLKDTTTNAPLILGNWELPGVLSWLVGGSTETVVQGLSAVHPSLWPPAVVHALFDIKLLIVLVLTLTLVAFVWFYLRRSAKAFSRPLQLLIVASPVLSVALVELGWMVTEFGRQPYAVYGHVFTADAITKSPGVLALGWLFPAAYVVLAVVTIAAIWRVVTTMNGKGGAK